MPFLLMSYGLLLLAYWVCPSLKEKDIPTQGGQWMDAPEGWEKGQN